MKSTCYKFITIIIGVILSNTVWSAPTQNTDTPVTQIAVGRYVELGPIDHPLILTSNNNARSWLLNTWVLNEDELPVETSCSGSSCYILGSQRGKASLHSSNDYGKSWSNGGTIPGYIGSTSCSNNNCIAVGHVELDDTFHPVPSIALSNDNGLTWSKVNDIKNLSPILKGVLNKIFCTDNYCVAIGKSYLEHETKEEPIFVSSIDHGKSWELIHKITGLPANIQDLSLNHINCVEDTCVAAGTHTVIDYDKNDVKTHTLMLVTHNKGKSWKFIKEIPAINNLTHLSVDDLIITNGSFIVVGGYADKGFLQSLILVSDDGDSWKLINHITGTESIKMGWLKSVSCSESTCFATGSTYYAGGLDFGLTLLTSKDNGKSWSSIHYTTNTPYAADFDTIQCKGDTCIAMGNYVDGVDNSHAVFLISNDKGQSWSTETDNITNLPQNMFNIHFLPINGM